MAHNSQDRSGNSISCLTALAFGLCLSMANGPALAADVKMSQLRAAAERGGVPQEVELAGDYFLGRGVAQDLTLAAHWYERAAERGDPEAQNEIGLFYQTGVGIPADPARAFHWFQLAAASGLVTAKVNMGVAYVWGNGVPRDGTLAVQLFRESVKKGSGRAASYLGDMYYFGTVVTLDKVVAKHWFKVGNKLHDPESAFNLGPLFPMIDGHPHDFPRAAELLRKAAASGYVPAMYSLGLLLNRHPELATSSQEAVAMLDTAAESGFWKSSIVLGILARDGRQVPKDPAAAYYHFKIAILQGGEAAKLLLVNDLKSLSGALTEKNTQELDSDAVACYQQHHLTLAFVSKDGENRKHFPASALTVPDDGVHAGHLVPPPPA